MQPVFVPPSIAAPALLPPPNPAIFVPSPSRALVMLRCFVSSVRQRSLFPLSLRLPPFRSVAATSVVNSRRRAGVEADNTARDVASFRYPSHFRPTLSLREFVGAYRELEDGARMETEIVCIAGRVTAKRVASGKLTFFDLTSDGVTVQV
jgi:hypothetical protein